MDKICDNIVNEYKESWSTPDKELPYLHNLMQT